MKSRKLLILICLFAVFALPPLLSWYAFNYTGLGQQRSSGGHGELIAPPRQLPDWSLSDPRGVTTPLRGKWTLLYPLRGECQEACLQSLYKMRQLRLTAGKNASRIQRAVLVVNGDQNALSAEQWQSFPGQLLLLPEQTQGADLRALFSIAPGDQPFTEQRLYLIDPLGNLMMSYAGSVQPAGIISDLRRLLKYSRIG